MRRFIHAMGAAVLLALASVSSVAAVGPPGAAPHHSVPAGVAQSAVDAGTSIAADGILAGLQ